MNIDLLLKEREKTLENNKKIPNNSKIEELDDNDDDVNDTDKNDMSTSILSIIQEPVPSQQYKQMPIRNNNNNNQNTCSSTDSESDDDSVDLKKQQHPKQLKPVMFKSLFENILSPFSSSSTLQQKQLPSFVSYLLLFFILVVYKLPAVDTFLYTYIPQLFDKTSKVYTIQGCVYISAILTVLYFIAIKYF